MLIAIPTYKRHSNGKAIILRSLFQELHDKFPITLFVREEEAEPYRKLIGNNPWTIEPMPAGTIDGIADTRNYMLEWCVRRGIDKICMVDDDVYFCVRGKIPGDDVHIRMCDPPDTIGMFSWLEEQLRVGYAHAAISMREGNNRNPGLGAFSEATRGIRVVAYNLAMLGDTRFRKEVEGREDLDMTLQLLRQGHANKVTYHWANGQHSSQTPGGLSEARTRESIHSSAEKLAALHPGFVKLRTQNNKSGGLAGERTEVTVYWRKAHEEGLRARDQGK